MTFCYYGLFDIAGYYGYGYAHSFFQPRSKMVT